MINVTIYKINTYVPVVPTNYNVDKYSYVSTSLIKVSRYTIRHLDTNINQIKRVAIS